MKMTRLQAAIMEVAPVERNGNLISMSVSVTLGGHPVGHLVRDNYAHSQPWWLGEMPEEVVVAHKLQGEQEIVATWSDTLNGGRKGCKVGKVTI